MYAENAVSVFWWQKIKKQKNKNINWKSQLRRVRATASIGHDYVEWQANRYVRQMKTTGICVCAVSRHATMLTSDSTTRREMATNSRASSQQIRIGRCMRKGWQTEEMPADKCNSCKKRKQIDKCQSSFVFAKTIQSRHLRLPQSPTTLRRHCGFLRWHSVHSCTHTHGYCRRQLHARCPLFPI